MMRSRSFCAARWMSRLIAVVPPTSASAPSTGMHRSRSAIDGVVRSLAVRARCSTWPRGRRHRRRRSARATFWTPSTCCAASRTASACVGVGHDLCRIGGAGREVLGQALLRRSPTEQSRCTAPCCSRPVGIELDDAEAGDAEDDRRDDPDATRVGRRCADRHATRCLVALRLLGALVRDAAARRPSGPKITSSAGSSVSMASKPTAMPIAATGPSPAVELVSANDQAEHARR